MEFLSRQPNGDRKEPTLVELTVAPLSVGGWGEFVRR